MFRLKATLVATTLMRPWRTGWSEDRGVDFSFAPSVRSAVVLTTAREDRPATEPASFLDADWAVPAGAVVVQRSQGPAAAEVTIEDTADTAPVQAWWSVSGKTSRT